MSEKTYGALVHDPSRKRFVITSAEAHVSIKLKNIFPKIPKGAVPPYTFPDTPQNCADLEWFMTRYPLRVEQEDVSLLRSGAQAYTDNINELEAILAPDYHAPTLTLNPGYQAREYQVQAAQVHAKVKRLLLGDALGVGKSLSAVLTLQTPGTLPAVVVVQTHMTKQWKEDVVEKFTNLTTHVIKGTRPYTLPPADVYIMKYSCLAGWSNFYQTKYFKSVIFDEIQELRNHDSAKYGAGKHLSLNVDFTLGLSATPVVNYGDEIFNLLDLLNPGCLDSRDNFLREWTIPYGRHHKVTDPKGLGSHLRENFLFLRRTREEVGRELDPVNKIVHYVEYDEDEVKKSAHRAKELAQTITSGSFVERGQAAQELDMLARYTTGVSKARGVAAYVRMLLEAGEPVVLGAWHRRVYEILLAELKEFNPVMYTGSETEKQKNEAKQAFVDGKTKLFIISLRSGAGLDGLQHVCKTVVIAELDWANAYHEQLIARVDRDGQKERVLAVFLVSESGSDPVITNLLGLKSSQAHGIVDPTKEIAPQYSDDSRIKLLAQAYLTKH
jgi:SNF2 family DNA or RNA helicase